MGQLRGGCETATDDADSMTGAGGDCTIRIRDRFVYSPLRSLAGPRYNTAASREVRPSTGEG